MKRYALFILLFLIPALGKAWRTDTVFGNPVLRQHVVLKAGFLVRGGVGGQGAILFAPKSWLHVQTGLGLTSTLVAGPVIPKRDHALLIGEVRLHAPNSYSFRGKFVGVYFSHCFGQRKYKEDDNDPYFGTTHKAFYYSLSEVIGIVIGGSKVGRRHDDFYVEGFFAAGWAMKVVVTRSDSPYFIDQQTPIARKEKFELKFGIMIGGIVF